VARSEREGIGDQLRRAIQASGLTAYKLSQDSGVSRSQLSRFLRGERDLSLGVADKVCELLGMRLTDPEAGPAVPSTPPAGELEAVGKKRTRARK
jgi:transcriptional regulator with XRE-family HTH domain